LTVACWIDMAHAVVYVMNLLPPAVYKRTAHATSCRVMSAYEFATGRKLNLMDTIAAPGELKVADCTGAKAYSCDNTCEILWLRFFRADFCGRSKLRDGSELEGAQASAVVSGCHLLVAENVRHWPQGIDNPNHYLVLLNPGPGSSAAW